MFKLHRHRSGKTGEKVDFRFSRFKVSQVPKGWDKLFISIISLESGKTIAKSGKAMVRNGSCQWAESLSECVYIGQDEDSKEIEPCIYKFVVSMGSARSSILGEATLNLTEHLGSRDASPVSLPLLRGNYGTILQFNVHCLSAKTKSRDESDQEEKMSLHEDLLNVNDDCMDGRSDESDILLNRSIGSSSSNHLAGSPHPDEHGNKDTSFSATGSHRSSDSGESFIGRTNLSPRNSLNGAYTQIGRQDSAGSQSSSAYGAIDDISRSNSSSFNSRIAGLPNHWQDRNADSHAASLKHNDSSKELLEAAQETIEELRGEARLWERNARKLKADLDALKKEFSEQSKHQADMDMQLKAAYVERDDLKLEIEQLKSSMDELMLKQISSNSKFQAEEHRQKELEDELRFHKESNANLSVQLKKTQESNIELVSILQELEETIEKQKLEIASFSDKNTEGMWNGETTNCNLLETGSLTTHGKFTEEANMISSLDLSTVQDTQYMLYSGACKGSDSHLIKEIDTLKVKIQELERDCAELTEENLELMLKMKDSNKGIIKSETNLSFSPDDGGLTKRNASSVNCTTGIFLGKLSSNDLVPENFQSMPSIYQLTENLEDQETFLTEPFVTQFRELKRKCADLELELQTFKNRASNLDTKFNDSQKELEQKSFELCEMRKRLSMDNSDILPCTESLKNESDCLTELSAISPEIYQQVCFFLSCMKKFYLANTVPETGLSIVPSDIDSIMPSEQMEVLMRSLLQLNNLVKTKIPYWKEFSSGGNLEEIQGSKNLSGTQEQHKDCILKNEKSGLRMELALEGRDLNLELQAYVVNMKEMNTRILQKEDEIKNLKHSKLETDDLLSNTQHEKKKIEEELEIALRESNIASKCLDDMQKEMLVLTSSMDSHTSANKLLERKSAELESSRQELEIHITELEQENVELSERISGLEAQLRYLTNDKESSRLELENSRGFVSDLKNEIEKLGIEMEKQKMDLKHKLQETQRRLSDSEEEAEYLKRSHSKLQVTVESLIEECNSLQRVTSDLKRQKLELHEHSTFLQVELNESKKRNTDFISKIETLEVKLSLLQKDINLKEKSLFSEVEGIFEKQNEHEETINQAKLWLNQMGLDKEAEIENLKQDILHLTAQLSSTPNEREEIASEALREVSKLRSEKIKLENNLREFQSKVKSYEVDICTIKQESDNHIQGLVGLLNASKQSEEMLMGDIEHMKRNMENVKLNEDKVKRLANELELKLKSSEYDREQISEEVSNLKAQLLKISHLQCEITTLKGHLDETKFEKTKLEESFQLLHEECERSKSENSSCMEKISKMQNVLFDAESDKRSRVALEEKLLRLECDLNAREALYAQDMELKNEMSRIKRTNSQYQRKIQCLEEERDELTRKFQALEKDFRSSKLENQDYKRNFPEDDRSLLNMHDLESKVLSLETELAEALETSNMYKLQVERQTAQPSGSTNSTSEDIRAEGSENRLSALEAELKDMRERYFQMSLRFAEVEAQREDLVMKLKSVKKEKRWFS